MKFIEDWLKYYSSFVAKSSISLGISSPEISYSNYINQYDLYKDGIGNGEKIYNIASISKVFTTINILKAEEDGVLTIEDKVSKYLVNYNDRETTIRDLLLHTAGLARDGDYNFWIDQSFPDYNQLESSIPNLKISNKGKYKYSNLGYALLGLILFKINRESIQKKVNSEKGFGKEIMDNRKVYSFVDHKSFTSSFGLYMNIKELNELAIKLLKKDNSLLKLSSWKKLYNSYLIREGEEDDIALGFDKWKNKRVYEASGYGFGFASSLLLDLDNSLAITVLINSSEEDFAPNFSRSIRRFILNFSKENIINLNSGILGFYQSKDYIVYVIDCGKKMFLIKPDNSNPFHPDNYEEYLKIDTNKYLLTNREEDPYINEELSFDFKSDKVIGFRQGGWGFEKVELEFN
jgi:hypothetical protein